MESPPEVRLTLELRCLRRLTILERAFLYGLAGLCVEVVFTAVVEAVSGPLDPRLVGQTYLWMLPIWAVGLLGVERLGPYLGAKQLRWPWRALVYVLGAFAIEYASGWTLREIVGTAPWDYSGAAASIDGLIRLDYAGGWALVGLTGERFAAVLRRARV